MFQARRPWDRLIKRENLFFISDIKRRKNRSKTAKTAHGRKRKPYGLKADTARQIIEFDMKHIPLLGVKLYAFCGIDQFTRETVVHIVSSPSGKNAKKAIKKIIARFGGGVKIINDNGSENMKDVETFLAQMSITQYWTRPHRPKDKAFNERFY
jgi:transposase InsO family protein